MLRSLFEGLCCYIRYDQAQPGLQFDHQLRLLSEYTLFVSVFFYKSSSLRFDYNTRITRPISFVQTNKS